MTSPSYRYITRLNALRRAYFGSFGCGDYDSSDFNGRREECDRVETPRPEVQDLLIFWRGCSATQRVLLAANFHTQEVRTAIFMAPWDDGTVLVDARVASKPREVWQLMA